MPKLWPQLSTPVFLGGFYWIWLLSVSAFINTMADAAMANNNIESSQQSPQTFAGDAEKRLVYGRNDALFGAIEKQQGDKPFGAFLDAGTGLHSLRWYVRVISCFNYLLPVDIFSQNSPCASYDFCIAGSPR